jgi:hypothetical protein
VEGAIGSEFKIDAMYLSPDMQIAHRVEEMCSEYSQSIILSQDFVSLLSSHSSSTLREIDTLTMNESKSLPRKVFTFDMNYNSDNDNMQLPFENTELGVFVKHP